MRTDNSLDEYYDRLRSTLSAAKTDRALFKAIVNAPFQDKLHTTNLDLGIVVLVLVDRDKQTINRISFSNTEPAGFAIKASPKSFEAIKIPIGDKKNITAKAIRKQRSYLTSDWQYILSPAISPTAARFNQAESGMDCSVVFPFKDVRNGGALVFSFYQPANTIGAFHNSFMDLYTEMVGDFLRK